MSGEEAPIVVGAPTKRFNNGHKTYTASEAKFLTEIYSGEKKSQGKFVEQMFHMRRPRNTIMGEATPRPGFETTAKYFPDDRTNQSSLAQHARSFREQTPQDDPLYQEFKSKVQLVDSLNRQKTKIEEELRVVTQVLHHKKLILGMSSGTLGQVNVSPIPR